MGQANGFKTKVFRTKIIRASATAPFVHPNCFIIFLFYCSKTRSLNNPGWDSLVLTYLTKHLSYLVWQVNLFILLNFLRYFFGQVFLQIGQHREIGLLLSFGFFGLGGSWAEAQNKESLIRLYSICSWWSEGGLHCRGLVPLYEGLERCVYSIEEGVEQPAIVLSGL